MTATNIAALYDLTGRIALITGGAAGIGLECARHLGAAGATIIIVDIRESELADAVRGLTSDGVRATGWVGDISREKIVDDLVARAARKSVSLISLSTMPASAAMSFPKRSSWRNGSASWTSTSPAAS